MDDDETPEIGNLLPTRARASIKRQARDYAGLAIETLVEVCSDLDAGARDRVSAAKAILDEAAREMQSGAPQDTTEVDSRSIDTSLLDQSELHEMRRLILKARGQVES
jgi:hypothetical protein